MAEVADSERRNGQQFGEQWLVRIVRGDEWIELHPVHLETGAEARTSWPAPAAPAFGTTRIVGSTKTPRTSRAAKSRATGQAEGFIHIVRDQMEAPLFILVKIVVAAANPITVVVDERIFEG